MPRPLEPWDYIALLIGFTSEKDMLTELYKKHSTLEIGRMVGYSHNAVRRRLEHHGITRRRKGQRAISRRKLRLVPTWELRRIDRVVDKYGVDRSIVYREIRLRKQRGEWDAGRGR